MHTHSHSQVLQIMLPLRYDLIQLGGSWAQRQVFNVTMIQAAIKANKPKLALSILAELKVSTIVDVVPVLIMMFNNNYRVRSPSLRDCSCYFTN